MTKAKKLASDGLKEIYVSNQYLLGKYLIKDVKIGEEEFKIGAELNETIIEKFVEAKIFSLELAYTNTINKGSYLLQTLFNDKNCILLHWNDYWESNNSGKIHFT